MPWLLCYGLAIAIYVEEISKAAFFMEKCSKVTMFIILIVACLFVMWESILLVTDTDEEEKEGDTYDLDEFCGYSHDHSYGIGRQQYGLCSVIAVPWLNFYFGIRCVYAKLVKGYLLFQYYAFNEDKIFHNSRKAPNLFTATYAYPNKSDTWVGIFEQYKNRVKVIHNKNNNEQSITKYLICKYRPLSAEGLSNRLNSIVSGFLLALATNRTLLVHWPEYLSSYNPIPNEVIATAAFEDIFQSPPSGLRVFAWSNDKTRGQNCISHSSYMVQISDAINQYELQNGTFEKDNDQVWWSEIDCLYVEERWDYWGNLLLHNKHLRSRGVYGDPDTAFQYIVRFLFQPKYEPFYFTIGKQEQQCSWLIQHRTRWQSYITPDFLKKVECAKNNGWRQGKEWMYILTDEISDPLIDEFMDKNKPFVKMSPLPYCRGLPYCDSDVFHLMYLMSQCQNAVTSYESTFGNCIVKMGNMKQHWVVIDNLGNYSNTLG